MRNIFRKIQSFMKKEPVFVAACILMILSAFFIKPTDALLTCIDFRVLSLLFSLMAVVAGLKAQGVFNEIAHVLSKCVKNTRSFTLLMSVVCFFIAMLITNDVALITFVPLTLIMLRSQKEKTIIVTIVLETIAVNLGSMLTPIGNPQNLYLFSKSGMSVTSFVLCMLPIAAVSLVLVCIASIFTPKASLFTVVKEERHDVWSKWKVWMYFLLFIVCLLNVFHIIHYFFVLGIVLLCILITDRRVLKKVDYILLGTFVAFFIFIGNIGSVEAFKSFLEQVINGREILIGIVSSQIVSNVPAAMLLAGFTNQYSSLLYGVNIGGLGTIIASMASLISYKFYASGKTAKKGKYLLVFTIYNVIFLLLLVGFTLLYPIK